MKKSINDIKYELKNMLSERRYEHSLGVMEKAIELAKIYNVNTEKAAYSGLVHDIAKEMTIKQYYKYCKENKIYLTKDDRKSPSVIHGIVGADIVKRRYGFTKDMCDAIYYHTTGKARMTLLDKIVFVADKSEERTRIGEQADKLRKITKEEGLDAAILFIFDEWSLPKAINQKRIIHPNTIFARNYILENINRKNKQ